MELIIEITKSFNKDLKKLQKNEQEKTKDKINSFVESFQQNGNSRKLYRLEKIKLPTNLSSSLFLLRIDVQIRAIVTFEKDPLFNQTVLTLFRVIKHSELEKAFKSVADSLYQNFYDTKGKEDGGN